MTTELDTINNSAIELLPPQRPPSVVARQMLLEHAENMQTANQLAKAMVRTTMVPTRFQGEDKAGDATAAILYGSEIGLNPIQSLQRVIPIHGMPSIEARTMVALLTARGYKIRTVSQSNDSVTVEGAAPNGETAQSTWTIQRAIRAGYCPIPVEGSQQRPHVKTDWEGEEKTGRNGKYYVVNGNMKYITDPQAMLKAKAQSEVCRDLAPDVLMGISYSSEELSSERWDGTISVEPPRLQPKQSRPVTEDELFAEEVPVPGQGGGNDVGDGAEPSSGADPQNPPRDQDTTATETPAGAEGQDTAQETADHTPAPAEPEPTPEPVKAAAKKAPAKKTAPREDVSKYRAGLEKRLFALLGDAQISDREDRITIYRAVLERPDINSTNDLTDVEVTKVGDQLYRWQTEGVLDDTLNDIFNAAVLAAENAAQQAESTESTTEGN